MILSQNSRIEKEKTATMSAAADNHNSPVDGTIDKTATLLRSVIGQDLTEKLLSVLSIANSMTSAVNQILDCFHAIAEITVILGRKEEDNNG